MEQIDNSNYISIKVEVEGRTEIIITETIRIGTDQITGQIAETEDNTDKTEASPRYEQNYRRGNFRRNIRNYGSSKQ